MHSVTREIRYCLFANNLMTARCRRTTRTSAKLPIMMMSNTASSSSSSIRCHNYYSGGRGSSNGNINSNSSRSISSDGNIKQQQQQQQLQLRPFQIEQYEGWLAKGGNLSDSDCEPMLMPSLLKLADDECLQLWDELSLGYPFHVQGDPLLRKQILLEFYPDLSSMSDDNNNNNSINNINCMAPQEGIFCTLHAILQPGDNVIISGRSYQSLSEIPRSIGCNVTHWLPELIIKEEGNNSQRKNSYFRFDPDVLRSMIRSNNTTTTATTSSSSSKTKTTKLVIVNFPHNPTGALPTHEEWDEIIEICRNEGCYLFCDEMYKYLEHNDAVAEGNERGILFCDEIYHRYLEHDDGKKSDTLKSAVEGYERGISLGGLSKSFGLAGLRMGWIVCRDQTLMERIQQIKDYTTICTSTPTQILSLIAIRNSSQLIERCRNIVNYVKLDVKQFCYDHSNLLEWTEPKAGSFVFPKLLLSNNNNPSSSKAYCDQLLKNADLMLLPSSLFEYGEHNIDDSRVRISLGRKSIPETLKLWKEHMVYDSKM